MKAGKKQMVVLGVALSLVFPVVPPSFAASEVSLAEYSALVLQYYPALRKQLSRVSQAVARKGQARSGHMPRLSALASVGSTNDPVGVFSSKLKQESFTAADFEISRLNSPDARTNFQGALEAHIPLFNAFQTLTSVEAAEHILNSEEYGQQSLRMEALLSASRVYMESLLWQEIDQVSQAVLEAALKDLEQAEDLKDRGVVLGADYYAAQVVERSLKQFDLQAKARVQAILHQAEVLAGGRISGQKPEGELPLPGPEEGALPDWLDRAHAHRPDIKALHEVIAAQEQWLKKEKRAYLPRVNAFGRVESNTRDFEGSGENYTAGLLGRMDLWDPSRAGRVGEQEQVLEELGCDLQQLRDAVSVEVSDAWQHCQALRRQVPEAAQAVRDAEEAVRLVIPLYEEGRKSIADLLELRKIYLDTRVRLGQLKVEAELGYLQLMALAGELNETHIQQLSRRLGS
ncbi:MAG: TolC family protein [Candidatus Omnitrophica bacterium]|nr:TolC family protein [Candidatus Omnitrophota bacterium]